ncbi:MAG TPA: VOC family protein [Acidothermales bacterium]|jgi:predicted enzyme related to lactoylglutathione lyase
MINGIHGLIYTPAAEEVRTFFRDVLEFPAVDAGGGWLIFALPPAELGIHPAETNSHELYLMCDDIEATRQVLSDKGVEFTGPVFDAGFGRVATIALPGGGELALYEPRHPTAVGLP